MRHVMYRFTMACAISICTCVARAQSADACSDYERIDIASVATEIVAAVRKRAPGPDVEYLVEKETCPERITYSFEATGKYHNPGFHWLVRVDRRTGRFEVVDGM